MITSTILASAMLIFIGKMFACGFLGFFLLIAIRMLIDIKMNPRGWKFGNELYDHKEDSFFGEVPEKTADLKLQRIPVRNNFTRKN